MKNRTNGLLNIYDDILDTDGLELKSDSLLEKRIPKYTRVKYTDLNKKYNKLTVLGIAGLFPKISIGREFGESLAVVAKCDCGNIAVYNFSMIKKGNTKSCGCLALEARSKTGKSNATHGATVNLKEKVEFRKELKIRLEIEFGKKGINERLKNHLKDLYPEMITIYPNKVYKNYNPIISENINNKELIDSSINKKTDIEVLYNRYKSSANKRGFIFTLTIDEYKSIINKNCIYCGDKVRKFNGIDRINNEIGYTFENSAPCCASCNFLKGRFDKDDFLIQVNKISNYQNTVQPGAGIMTPA